MVRWWDGEMVGWWDGEMVRWWDGEMVRWWDGERVRVGEGWYWLDGEMVRWWDGLTDWPVVCSKTWELCVCGEAQPGQASGWPGQSRREWCRCSSSISAGASCPSPSVPVQPRISSPFLQISNISPGYPVLSCKFQILAKDILFSLANIRYFPIFIKPAHVSTESNNSLESSQNILNINFWPSELQTLVRNYYYRHKAPPPSSQTSPGSDRPRLCSGTHQCRSSSAPSPPAPGVCPPPSPQLGVVPRHTEGPDRLLGLWEPSCVSAVVRESSPTLLLFILDPTSYHHQPDIQGLLRTYLMQFKWIMEAFQSNLSFY